MTDKTTQNKADIPVNTTTAPAGTTDATRNSGPKSRTLPQADALKARFKAGSIPLQTDFADLIDLANIGRQAVGGAKDQTGPAHGFTLSSEGRLELKPNAAKGISVDTDGVAVKVNTKKGLNVDNEGVAVKINTKKGLNVDNEGVYLPLGWGLAYGGDGLDVTCKANGGLRVQKEGPFVIPGYGIAVNSSGVNIKLAKGADTNGGGGHGTDGATFGRGGGLNLTANGLCLDAGDGMQINSRGVSIKLAANSGLSADEDNGLKLVPEQTFQKGMIMMFSGTSIPPGWALCDGSPGTPNLIDRFILGSKPAESGKFNSATLTGSGNSKFYSKESSSETVTGTISIGSTTLTEKHIPSHRHIGGTSYRFAKHSKYDYLEDSKNFSFNDANCYSSDTSPRNPYTSSTGGGEGHTHTGIMSTTAHKHTTDVIPPYYTLAFIIKL